MKKYRKNVVGMPPKKWRTICVRKPIYDVLKKIAEEKQLSVTELVEEILKEKIREVDKL